MNTNGFIFDDFVEKSFHFKRIDSTNSFAKNLSDAPRNGLFVIVSDEQSTGRGQRDNVFCSPPGGLYVSLICPIADISRHFTLNRGVSLAVCDAVSALCPGAALSIKWPNDVFLSDKKVCGILLESMLYSTRHLVVGFGVNVNGEYNQFPRELRNSLTSLKIQTQKAFDIPTLLCDICRRFQAYRFSGPVDTHALYIDRLYGRGNAIRINGQKGTLETVLEDGRLCLRTGKGLEYVSSGSIEFLSI